MIKSQVIRKRQK